ncbi:MAG: hypothetical protein INH37_27000, partial [Myxococcaceae bacterium]|nr:hypothetical protein [Myxococcaceae bacterium]
TTLERALERATAEQGELSALRDRLAAHDATGAAASAVLAEAQARAADLDARLDGALRQLAEVEARAASARDEREQTQARLEAELTALRERTEGSDARLAEAARATSDARAALEALQRRVSELEAELTTSREEARAGVEVAVAARKQAEDLLLALRAKYGELQQELAQLSAQSSRGAAAIDELAELRAENELIESERQRLADVVDALEQRLKQLEDLEARAQQLEAELSRATAAQRRDAPETGGTVEPPRVPPAAPPQPPPGDAPGRAVGVGASDEARGEASTVAPTPPSSPPPAPSPAVASPDPEVFELEITEGEGEAEEIVVFDEEVSWPEQGSGSVPVPNEAAGEGAATPAGEVGDGPAPGAPVSVALPPPLKRIVVPGEHRVILHMMEGQLRRGSLVDVDLGAEALTLREQGGATDPVASERVKAVFFLVGAGATPSPGDGARLRVTFKDGRQVVGRSPDEGTGGPGFFVFPADNRTSTDRIFVFRHGVASVATEE